MRSSTSTRVRPRLTSVIVGVLVLLAATTAAIAAAASSAGAPVPGATYKGTINDDPSLPISFEVSSDGSTVTNMRIPYALRPSCDPNALSGAQLGSAQPAPIGGGAFGSALTYSTTPQLTAYVSGQFVSNRTASGQVNFVYVRLGLPPSPCTEAATFTAKAPASRTKKGSSGHKKHHKKKRRG